MFLGVPYQELYFIQTDLICLATLVFILIEWSKQKKDISTGKSIIRFSITASMIFCISDMFAGIFNNHIFEGSFLLLYVLNIIYFISAVAIALSWAFYAVLRVGKLQEFNLKKIFCLTLPALVFYAVLISTPFTHLIFSINKETCEYSRGNFAFLHWIASSFYVVYGVYKLLKAITLEKNKARKIELKALLFFPVAPLFMLTMQIIFEGLSLTQFGFTFSILLLYIKEQSLMIQTDDLTKLNNRRSLDIYIESNLSRNSNPLDITFLMIDINHFKEINDNYGHFVGDKVLKIFSEVLKTSCETSLKRLFLCRYGGDEFIIVGIDMKEEDIVNIKKTIYKNMQEKIVLDNFDFKVNASIGVGRGKAYNIEDTEHLIRVADEDMYENKRAIELDKKKD